MDVDSEFVVFYCVAFLFICLLILIIRDSEKEVAREEAIKDKTKKKGRSRYTKRRIRKMRKMQKRAVQFFTGVKKVSDT